MPISVNDQTNLTSLKFTSWLGRLLKPSTYISLVLLLEDVQRNKDENVRVRTDKETQNRTKGRVGWFAGCA